MLYYGLRMIHVYDTNYVYSGSHDRKWCAILASWWFWHLNMTKTCAASDTYIRGFGYERNMLLASPVRPPFRVRYSWNNRFSAESVHVRYVRNNRFSLYLPISPPIQAKAKRIILGRAAMAAISERFVYLVTKHFLLSSSSQVKSWECLFSLRSGLMWTKNAVCLLSVCLFSMPYRYDLILVTLTLSLPSHSDSVNHWIAIRGPLCVSYIHSY